MKLRGIDNYFTDSESEAEYTDHEEPDPKRKKADEKPRKEKKIQLPTSGMLLPPFILEKNGVNFTSWKSVLKNELSAWNLEFMIDGSLPDDIPETELKRATGWTNAFILSRLENALKQAVADLETPSAMLNALENMVQPVIPTARFAVKRLFQNIVMKNDETVDQFLKRFDECKKRMELYDSNSDKKQREIDAIDNLLAAIKHRYRDVVTSFNAKEDGLKTLESLKAELKSEEATVSDSVERGGKEDGDKTAAFVAVPHSSGSTFRGRGNFGFRSRSHGRSSRFRGHGRGRGGSSTFKYCTRCGKNGHSYKECYNPKWKCYQCQQMVDDHQGWNCPNNATVNAGKSQNANLSRYKWSKESKNVKKFPQKRQNGSGATANVVQTQSNDNMSNEDETVNNIRYPGKNTINNKVTIYTFLSDSGADEHFVNSLKGLNNIRSVSSITVKIANKDSNLKITHVGDLVCKNENGETIKIKNVYYSPSLAQNLFSLRQFVNKGATVILDNNLIRIFDKTRKLIIKGNYDGRFWWLSFVKSNTFWANIIDSKNKMDDPNVDLQSKITNASVDKNEGSALKNKFKTMEDAKISPQSSKDHDYAKSESFTYKDISDAESLSKYLNIEAEMNLNDIKTLSNENVAHLRKSVGMLWHLRLGHSSKTYLDYAAKIIPELKNVRFPMEIIDCEDCKLAKSTHLPNNTVRYRYEEALHCIHTDLMGPIDPPTVKHNAKYIVSFIDDATRYAVSYPLTEKKFVYIAFENFLKEVRKSRGPSAKIGILRLDNGTEYKTTEMKQIIEREGIEVQTTPPRSSNLNGTAEKFNRDIMEKTRALMISAGFPEGMWAYGLSFAVDIHNRTPRGSINFRSPFELFHKRNTTVKYIRRFGSLGFAYVPAPAGKKICERAARGFLVHCAPTHYVLIQPATGKIIRSQNVVFVESKVYKDFYPKEAENALSKGDFVVQSYEDEWSLESYLNDPKINPSSLLSVTEFSSKSCENSNLVREEFSMCYNAQVCEIKNIDESNPNGKCEVKIEPKTFREAMCSKHRDDWLIAVNNELASQYKNETWSLIDKNTLPKNTPILRSGWVFKCKMNPDDTFKFKARLVIKGYADKNEYDLFETYSPVARMMDVRFFLSVANKYNLDIHQLDVTTAFLHGTLEKSVYMTIPEGYKNRDTLMKTKVCHVKKALYGLKTSPKVWYNKVKDELSKLKFSVYVFQSCIFVWRCGNRFILILLYVDDILIIGNCPEKITELKKYLAKIFEIKDLGPPKKFVGFEIVRNRECKTLLLHQSTLINNILKRFDMQNCTPVDTPCSTLAAEKKTLTRCFESLESLERKMPYREVVGSLMYIANGTRPDIAFSVNIVSRNQDKYTIDDYTKVKRILKYLQGTKHMGLIFRGNFDNIECFVDASLGTNDISGKSTTGFVVKMFGDVISWRSKKQVHVALSSAEAEFIAMSVACKEVVCLKEMAKRLLKLDILPVIYEDNTSAIKMAKTEDSQSLKHIVKLCFHYIRFEAIKRNVEIKWISTADQIADALTKAVPKDKFIQFRSDMCIE